MEASIPASNTEMALSYRCLAIAVSGETLRDKCPLVGVGLVYTLPYLPKVAFSTAYMHLNEWYSAVASDEVSEDPAYYSCRLPGRVNSFPLQTSTPSCWMWSPLKWCVTWRGLFRRYP